MSKRPLQIVHNGLTFKLMGTRKDPIVTCDSSKTGVGVIVGFITGTPRIDVWQRPLPSVADAKVFVGMADRLAEAIVGVDCAYEALRAVFTTWPGKQL